MVAASAEYALIFSLYPGNAGDAPQGRALLERLGPAPTRCNLAMDRAYEGNETQRLCRMPETLCRYFDFEAFARDAMHNGDVYGLHLDNGQLAVFYDGR